jgi:phage shock protein PspC (stress-responsive transcriptional regulator)
MADERKTTPARLARVPEGRILGGVCTGLARHTGIDPVVYRVGFAILVLAGGQGILLYIAAALVMPASPGQQSVAERMFRRRFDATGTLSIIGALLFVAVLLSILSTGFFGAGAGADAVAVLTVFGLVLLVAHGRGVDLAGIARSFPERVQGLPAETTFEERPAPVSFEKAPDGALPEGMIDLARLGAPRAPQAPYDPVPSSPSPAATLERCKGGRPALTSITLLGALAAGAAMIPMARTHPGPEGVTLVMATALAVVGAGLLMGGWFRARGLAAMGTVLTCALLTTSVAAEAPPGSRYGEVEWRPTEVPATQDYKIAAGSGRLDLTKLPLLPGQRVSVNAEIWLGELDVTLPKTARVEIDARVRLGDLGLPGRSISGPGARADLVLEPEGPKVTSPPVIVLRIRGQVSDVQVSRG